MNRVKMFHAKQLKSEVIKMKKYNDTDIINDDDLMEYFDKTNNYKLYDKTQQIYIENYNKMYKK